MKAKKTPSGKYTCLAYYKDADGIEHRKRFTADNPKVAKLMAQQFELDVKDHQRTANGMTLNDAIRKYVAYRERVISPSTLRLYKGYARQLQAFGKLSLDDVNQERVQEYVNELAITLEPKGVRNIHGFLSAVLKTYRPDMILRTTLPQNIKPNLYTPTDEDFRKLLNVVRGTKWEIPVLLSATSSLRRSEICALTIEDVGDGWIRVDKAMVLNDQNEWVIKTTKSEAGTRISYPPVEVTDLIKRSVKSGRVVTMSPASISSLFPRLLKKYQLPAFRFHALRSYWCSVMHYLGVPDKYIMEMGGWQDVGTVRSHYEKAMPDKIPDMARRGSEHFEELLKK